MPNVITPSRELLGDGDFWFDRWAANGTTPTGAFRYIGNITSLMANVQIQTEETFEHSTGKRQRTNYWITRTTGDLEWSCSEHWIQNLALASMGDDSTPYTQSSATVTA